jgi:hypothetical protein
MNSTAMMSEVGMAERRWMRWGVIQLCWVVIGLFIAGRNIVSSVSRGAPIAWDEGVLFEMIYYLIWGLFTPVIFWFARRHHIQRRPKKIHRVRILRRKNSRIWERPVSKTNYHPLPGGPPARSSRSHFKHITRRETWNGDCPMMKVANGQSSIDRAVLTCLYWKL